MQEIGLFEVEDVRGERVGRAAQCKAVAERGVVEDGGCDVEQIVRQGAEGGGVAKVVALADVAFQNGVRQGFDIFGSIRRVGSGKGREGAIVQIVVQCGTAGANGPRGGTLRIDLACRAVFAKRKGKEFDGVIAPGEVGGQFTAQQLGVGAGDQKAESAPEEAVDEEIPLRNVLDFVQEEALKIALKLIEDLEYDIVVLARGLSQTFIVEVYIGEGQPTFAQD